MKNFLLWFKIIRPQTLFASLVPVLVGLYAIHADNMLVGVLTAISSMSLQILSNLINDYYDFLRGTDKAGRVGFRRALAEGLVNKKQMLIACIISASVAITTGMYLIYIGGIVIFLIGVTAMLFAWLYTATSHSLSYLGIADIFVFLYYGVVASCGTAYLQTHEFSLPAFYAGGVCGLISMCVLMINNLRDMESDRESEKKTLPVRFGKTFAHGFLMVEILLMPVLAYLAFGFSPAVFVILPGLMLFIAVVKAVGSQYNKCLLAAGIVNVIYLVLCLLNP